jgi:hypothetical protein
MKPITQTEYRGGAALTLATRALELTVTTSVGPRVVSFRPAPGRRRNVFLEIPASEPRYHGLFLRGGHRLWHAPEHIVRTYQPDDDPLAVKRLAAGVALTAPTEAKTGLQKAMTIELRGERTVKVTHTLTNRGLWAAECAAWPVTMLRGGGYGVIPLPPKGSHEDGDLLPAYALVPWSYTDLSLPLWNLRRDFIGIDVAKAKQAQKLGLTSYPGWSACWLEGVTFVKYAPVLPATRYPDLGSAFETFTNGAMLEFETLGPLVSLRPGQKTTQVEYWTLIEGLQRPDNDRAFSRSLAPAVKAWIAGLKR